MSHPQHHQLNNENNPSFIQKTFAPLISFIHSRSRREWGKIIVFYFFFYAALAAFFAVCLIVMLQTIDPKVPTVTGRTNKPVLAISNGALYTMNLKSTDAWTSYTEAVDDLISKYAANTASDATKKFTWDATTMGDCADSAVFNKNTDTEKSGCFFMGLNRMYKWEPFDSSAAENANKHLSYKCELGIGKAGDGNKSPPFTHEMSPAYEDQELEKYYPWTSMEESGLQPVVGLKITMNIAQMKETAADKLTSYINCNAYIRSEDGTEELLPGARPMELTVKFNNK